MVDAENFVVSIGGIATRDCLFLGLLVSFLMVVDMSRVSLLLVFSLCSELRTSIRPSRP